MKVMLADFHKFIGYSGGIENVFAKMASALSERNYDVIAVFADEKTEGEPFFAVPKSVKLLNLYHLPGEKSVKPSGLTKALREVIRPFSRAAARDQNYRLLYQAKAQLSRLLEKEKPDVIVSFREPTGRLLLDGVGTKIPVISMLHNDPDEIFCGSPTEERKALEKSAAIQVLLPSFISKAKKYLHYDHFIAIPNAVNAPHVTADHLAKKDKYTITCVGRLTGRTKRQHLLIEAFARLSTDHPDWQVKLWGDTYDKPYVASLRSKIKKYGLGKQVFLCGTTKDMDAVWKETDIFAFPSHHEGFGLALAEAMCCGIPAVGYRSCPAVNELIQSGETGLLVEEGASALAEGLKKLMESPVLRERFGKNAQMAAEMYRPEIVWRKWEEKIGECSK